MPSPISPSQLLAQLGISVPEDIDLEAIAQFCGATILYEPLDGCEACIIGVGDRAIITVNRNSSRPRQRFSGGHELGHWIRDRGNVVFRCTERVFGTEWSQDNPERRANRFAADLLLPQEMFVSRANRKPITFDTVDGLADLFQTSSTATAIRLVEHGSLPSMVICSDAHRRKWFMRSEILPESLWPHEVQGRDTVAFKLHRETSAIPPGPTPVSAAQWINHRNAARYVVTEDSRRTAAGLVLTLLWWKDEQQLLDLDNEQEEEDTEEDRNPYDFD